MTKQLRLSDINSPTPILNNNQGRADWVESGCKTTTTNYGTNKLVNSKLQKNSCIKEINIPWIAGKTKNPADIFTKKDKDMENYRGL